jgi:hypothetical protein
MYVLDGGPRSGQLVDDLPSGYALETPALRALPGAMIADIPAAVAVWKNADHRPVRRLHRLN